MNLKPGRELDSLVAEHVLKLIPCGEWGPGPMPAELMKNCQHPEGSCNPRGVVWGYSMEPGWAKVIQEWVIEKINPFEGSFQLIYLPKTKSWTATIRIGIMVVSMSGETLEHACCLLALKLAGAPLDFRGYDSPGNPDSGTLARILEWGPEMKQ